MYTIPFKHTILFLTKSKRVFGLGMMQPAVTH